ncbi:hypothetical protein [Streptomyces sp. PU-14G]
MFPRNAPLGQSRTGGRTPPVPGDAAEVHDSDYREVGSWRVTAA